MKKTVPNHSGKRKRKTKAALSPPKRGAIWVRSTLSTGRVSNTTRDGAQYVRRANRKARGAGFHNARSYADYLVRLYEYAKRVTGGR
jgi:hypothetical protein